MLQIEFLFNKHILALTVYRPNVIINTNDIGSYEL